MKILQPADRFSRKGSSAWFTGDVQMDEVSTAELPSRLRAVRVSFSPRARTSWHTHPLGQALHVLAGNGLVQVKGKQARRIHPGDTVLIAPDELHWHGAAPDETMIHLALHEIDDHGVDVIWLDHVTDAEYDSPAE